MAKKKPAARKGKALYAHLDDIDRAGLFRVYCRNNGDIDATYQELKRRIPKKVLRAIEEDKDWPALKQLVGNKFLKAVVDQAVQDKKDALRLLHNIKAQAYNSIIGERDPNDPTKYIKRPVPPKSQGEAIDSLLAVLKEERELLGDAMPENTEAPEWSLLRMVLQRFTDKREKAENDNPTGQTVTAESIGIKVDVGPN